MVDPFAAGLPRLTSARTRLRAPRDTDAAQILAVFGNAEAMRYWSHEPFAELEQAHAYLASMETGVRERALYQWAVTDPSDKLIGTVTFHRWNRTHRRGEIGFILHPDHQGKGLATEAVELLLRFLFTTLDLHRVEADVDPENTGCRTLLERLGFREEGHLEQRWFTYGAWHDTVLYGLLRSRFAATRSTS